MSIPRSDRSGTRRRTPTEPGSTRDDTDGVRVVERPGVRKSVWLASLALGLLAATLIGLARLVASSLPASPPPEPARVAQVVAPAPVVRAPGGPVPRATARPPPPAPAPSPAQGAVPAADVPPPPPPPGVVPSGISLFPPPGTDPPRVGIVVPDDFELPEGYLRHHQATDDGQELAPILMFHPDYEWVDERGVAIELPADRVVPAELAPPGLAIELLEIPAPRVESDPAP